MKSQIASLIRVCIILGITYPCKECDYVSNVKTALKIHVETKHELLRKL